jgi:hypothetical protein
MLTQKDSGAPSHQGVIAVTSIQEENPHSAVI